MVTNELYILNINSELDMMFSMTERAQTRACEALVALIEEWGAERITVQMPEDWSKLGSHPIGAVKVEFCTTDNIAICVDGGKVLALRFNCKGN